MNISISRRGLAATVLIAALAIAVAVFGVLWWSARGRLDDQAAERAHREHAQQVAAQYAVGASTINYQDMSGWIGRLKSGTSPTLSTRFDTTGPKLQGILVPLQWVSTATPITAVVASESGGVYRVNVFIDVSSTNAQAPEGNRSTVTYDVTVDSTAGWQVTDVGGMDGALPLK